MRKQAGVSLMGLIITLIVLAVLGLFAAKLMPAYIEYFQVKKIFAAMKQGGDLNNNPPQIRAAFDRRNAIEDVKSISSKDLDITKDGGETVVSVEWSTRVPIAYNASACLEFAVTSAQ